MDYSVTIFSKKISPCTQRFVSINDLSNTRRSTTEPVAEMSLLKMPLQQFNPHILCVLCGGYLVDATTVIECLHSFCRSCIVKYLQTSFHCPVCDVEVHKTKPLLHIRPDRPLQEIVNKLVPGLVYDELGRRKKFEENLNKENAENEGVSEDISCEESSTSRNSNEVDMKDPVYITLEYYRRKRNWNEKQVFPTRYLRCPSAITVRVLKKFLIMKFAIPNTHKAELVRSDELLSDSLTMKELSQIYGLYTKSFLDLQYSFLDVRDDNTTEDEKKESEPPRKLKKSDKKHKKYETANVELKQEGTSSEKTLESNSDYLNLNSTLDGHAFQRDFISPSFPETPPSFECDEIGENKGHVTTS